MSVLTPEVVDILMNLSCPLEEKTALMKALVRAGQTFQPPAQSSGVNEERERLRNESTYAERKRAKDRERQRQLREIARQSRDTGEDRATSTATEGDTTATDGDETASPSCTRKLPLSSSLRSEALPPENPTGSTPKGADRGRGSRLPDGWRPDEDGWTYAVQLLESEPAVQAQLDRFRDYWRAVAGAKGRKVDWPATWRNWCRTASENSARKAHERPHHDAKFDARQANLARALAGADSAARRDWKP